MAEAAPEPVAAASVPAAAAPAGKSGAVPSIDLGPKLTLLLEHDALVIHGMCLCCSPPALFT